MSEGSLSRVSGDVFVAINWQLCKAMQLACVALKTSLAEGCVLAHGYISPRHWDASPSCVTGGVGCLLPCGDLDYGIAVCCLHVVIWLCPWRCSPSRCCTVALSNLQSQQHIASLATCSTLVWLYSASWCSVEGVAHLRATRRRG